MAFNVEDFELVQADTDDPHLVFVQHGSHGHFSDMGFLAKVLCDQCRFAVWSNYDVAALASADDAANTAGTSSSTRMPPLVIYHTDANEGFMRTDYGLEVCSDRAFPDLKLALERFIASHTEAETIRFSVLGHSYGGIIARDLVSRVYQDPAMSRLHYTLFITIATPHLGTRNIVAPLRYGGMFLGFTNASRSYAELFLMGDQSGPLATKLIDEAHLEALEAFEHRYLLGNVTNDFLVHFPTSTLCWEGTTKAFATDEGLTTHTLRPLLLLRQDHDADPKDHVRGYPEPGSEFLSKDGFEEASVEYVIASTLRRRMDFFVVPVVSKNWYPSAHTAVVSSRRRPFETLMDDVSYALAGLIVSHGLRWPSLRRI